MNRKHAALIACLCALTTLLSSCAGSGVPLKEETQITLPPADSGDAVAPIGDAALEYEAPATLYLPRHDGARLIAVPQQVTFSAARLHAESLVRALLASEGSGVASAVGGSVRLSLYGANPVEVSGDVATVNLSASALQLDRKSFYLACQAIANTLTELDGLTYVNVQVMDKQIGLDLASTLPTGAFTRSVGADVSAAYEQTLAQRVSAGEDASQKRLTSVVTLYFPLSALDGVEPEARSISFTSQALPDMIVRILQELSEGPDRVTGSPALPLLSELLAQAPTVTELPDGGKQAELAFTYSFDDMLQTCGVSRASCLAALCNTLCTFLPNLTSLTVTIGDEKVDHLRLAANQPEQALLFEGGVQRRANYASFLLAPCTLYFTDGTQLVACERPVAFYQRQNPRFLLLELARGPQPQDSVQGLSPVMPVGALRDADVLGVSLHDGTLLVNFAQTFAGIGGELTESGDRLLAYALVNTLFCGPGVRRVRFFVAGGMPKGFTGEIYWGGDFYRNLGLVRSN